MQDIKIDFNIPVLAGNELAYIQQAFTNQHISGDGQFSKKASALLEKELGVSRVILTTSCTHALEMAALLLDIKEGDEVIIPSFTFVSTVNAFVLRGARPVFIDIRPDTLNLDEAQLEKLITERTKAVVPVHYAGVGCEMDAITAICQQHNLQIVEDNAHGLFGKYHGKHLGTFGALATQSFHETKNVTCGEGGALLINDPSFIDRAEIIREKGTNRARFYRGMVDKYTWVDIGSSYLPSEILAAVLYAQLEKWQAIQEKRKAIWHYYHDNLLDWAVDRAVQLPFIPAECDSAYHMYYLITPDPETRTLLTRHLRERGIVSVFHYQSLHLSEMGLRFGGKPGDCPVTEHASDCLLRLPFYNSLSFEDQDYVLKALKDFTK